jgi:hypothetical protein
MVVICSWCKKVIGENWLEPVGVESHGICSDCLIKVILESNESWEHYMLGDKWGLK